MDWIKRCKWIAKYVNEKDMDIAVKHVKYIYNQGIKIGIKKSNGGKK